MISVGIAVFVNYKWGYTQVALALSAVTCRVLSVRLALAVQPLLMMCFMQPGTLYDNKALHIHLRGKSGPEYERPWAAAAADNPLAQWAERKKKEAEEAAANGSKKKD